MENNFKEVGAWWNDSNIDLVEIDGTVYALNGWKCSGEYNMDASKEYCTIKPQYREIEEDESEIVGYEVM